MLSWSPTPVKRNKAWPLCPAPTETEMCLLHANIPLHGTAGPWTEKAYHGFHRAPLLQLVSFLPIFTLFFSHTISDSGRETGSASSQIPQRSMILCAEDLDVCPFSDEQIQRGVSPTQWLHVAAKVRVMQKQWEIQSYTTWAHSLGACVCKVHSAHLDCKPCT